VKPLANAHGLDEPIGANHQIEDRAVSARHGLGQLWRPRRQILTYRPWG
jgi:hypothetical protein